MAINWTENILKTYDVSLSALYLQKDVSSDLPPGPPPRPGLKWNPQSHRWIKANPNSMHEKRQRKVESGIPKESLTPRYKHERLQQKHGEIGVQMDNLITQWENAPEHKQPSIWAKYEKLEEKRDGIGEQLDALQMQVEDLER